MPAAKLQRRNNRVSLSLERLEDRCVPATIIVSNTPQLNAAFRTAGNFDTIQMQPGVYSVLGGAVNASLLSINLTVKAATPNSAIIEGANSANLVSILNPDGNPGSQIQFQDIIFQNGRSALPGQSGGVSILNTNVTFTRCLFQGNIALNGPGGGAVLVSGNSNAHFTQCTWQGNGATNNGGAMEVINGPTVIIDENIFVGNSTSIGGSVPTSQGGAIAIGTTVAVNTTVTVNNTRFDGNQNNFAGGAIHAQGVFQGNSSQPNTFLNINNCTFVNNKSVRAAANTTPGTVQGGAVSVEDATVAIIGVSRFTNNVAEGGGAIQLFRSTATVDQCYFENNRAITGTGGGLGGSISAGSISPGEPNRPKANLTVTNSYFTGAPNGTDQVALSGGAIEVSGDRLNFNGSNLAAMQARLVVNNVIFANLVVRENVSTPGSGTGGAIGSDLGNVSVGNSVFMNNKALAAGDPAVSQASGGAFAALSGSTVAFAGSTFSNNLSDRFGGAVFAQGAQLNVNQSSFFQNTVTFSPSEFDSKGAAIFTGILRGSTFGTTGSVTSSLFSQNNGIAIYEDDDASGSPVNLMVYGANQFFSTAFPTGDIFFSGVAGGKTVAGLNTLVLHGQPKTPNQDNVSLPAVPVVVQLFGAPDRLYTFTAFDDATKVVQGVLAWVISGVPNAVLQTPSGSTSNANAPNGLIKVTTTGIYTLTTGGTPPATKTMIKPTLLIAGADRPAGAYVPVFDGLTGQQVRTLLVYDPFFSGGARVAMGDVNGDSNPDFVISAGPGGGPNVKVFDGVTGSVFLDFFAFNPGFTGGSWVAAGDIIGSGRAQIIIGADAGGGPNVIAFDNNLNQIVNFFAFPSGFTGGARVAAGNTTVGGNAEIIVGAGPGGGPQVAIFRYNGTQNPTNVNSFFVLPPAFTGGVFVGAGDVAGIGRVYIVSGAAPGGGPNVTVIDPLNSGVFHPSGGIDLLQSFFALPAGFTGGVRVAAGASQNDLPGSLLSGAGPGGGPNATAFGYVPFPATPALIDSFFVFESTFLGGIFVASA